MAGLMQEHRREQRCWMLCREDVIPQVLVILKGTQDHTRQGAGPGLALLARCFTDCNSLLHPKCSLEHLSCMMRAAIYCKNEL